jgi:DHA2 family multidrug resistance protein-like MFS transporter
VVIAFALMSFGGGPLVALGTDLVVGSAPPAKAGSAAALAETGNEMGYALGIAALGSIGTAVYRAQMANSIPAGTPATAAAAARDTLAGATAAAQSVSEQLSTALLATAGAAFVSELHVVAAVSAAVLSGVAVLCATALRHLSPLATAQPNPTRSAAESAVAGANHHLEVGSPPDWAGTK